MALGQDLTKPLEAGKGARYRPRAVQYRLHVTLLLLGSLGCLLEEQPKGLPRGVVEPLLGNGGHRVGW